MSNENPWAIKKVIDTAFEMAERNGFYLDEDRNYPGKVAVKAKPGSGVWTDDVVIAVATEFTTTIAWLHGYEKHEIYARMAKLPKKKGTKK